MSTQLEPAPASSATVTIESRTYRVLDGNLNFYRCERDDGEIAWFRHDAVIKGLGAPIAVVAGGGTADAIIASYQRGTSAMPTMRDRAAMAMRDLERMRAGLDMEPLSEADRQSILARCRAPGPRLTPRRGPRCMLV